MEEKEKLRKKRGGNYNLKYSFSLLKARTQKSLSDWKKAQNKFKTDVKFILKKIDEIDNKIDFHQEEIRTTIKDIKKQSKKEKSNE